MSPANDVAGRADERARLQAFLETATKTSRAASLTAPAIVELFQALVREGLDLLPMPGSGRTLQRWQALAAVAAHDLSLAKLYEGHTDAVAVMAELGDARRVPGSTWGMWAAEPPDAKVAIVPRGDGRVLLRGRKAWCSGAGFVSHGLMTAWAADGSGPWLVAVEMRQAGITVVDSAWCAVGMAASASLDVLFDGAIATPVGTSGDYLKRSGFWHGGAGIAACWYGGATGLALALHRAAKAAPTGPAAAFRMAALGKVDVALRHTAGLLRDAAAWIDAQPLIDASAVALRTRLSAETTATRVLDEAGRSLGAVPFCRDPHFARLAADLPVYLRQSHAERDFAALGERCASDAQRPWQL